MGVPWYVWRSAQNGQGGADNLPDALHQLARFLEASRGLATTGAVFAGQPSDGAPVVARVNLTGMEA